MSIKLRTIRALAIGLVLLGPLVAPVQALAASPALDDQVIADAYVYLIGRALVVRQEHLDVAAQGIQRRLPQPARVGRFREPEPGSRQHRGLDRG